jgi:hypothetical protein
MCHRNLISIESREVPLGTGSGSGTGTGTEYKYCCYKRMFLLFLLFNTFFLIQELASVRMKRFLTSRTAEDRADAAELARERSIHPWRDVGAPTSRRHSLSTRANPLLASRRISLADVSAPISPGQAYARAATAAAGYATPSFQPTVTSTPIQAAASMLPPPPPRPATSFGSGSPQHHRQAGQRPAQLSTSAAAASWHARAAIAREARRPAYSKPSHSTPPSAELVALAERFRSNAAAQSAPSMASVLKQEPDVSISDSFYSAILQNKSIIDSDCNDMGALVDVSIPPLTPSAYTVS